MTLSLVVSVAIDAPARRVWDEISDIASQPKWMKDAVAIRFTSASQRGTGTTFDCDTQVLFFTTTDRMAITEWDEGHGYTVEHQGAFSGTGVFSVTPSADGASSTFAWHETLRFPWHFAGPLGEVVARPILRHLWAADLASLKVRCEAAG